MLMGCKVNHIVGLVGLHPHHLFELVITVCRNVLTSVETEPKLTQKLRIRLVFGCQMQGFLQKLVIKCTFLSTQVVELKVFDEIEL